MGLNCNAKPVQFHAVPCKLRPHRLIARVGNWLRTAIRKVCARFIALCRMIGLLTQPSVAIDGSKFKAVHNRDKNFTRAKMERRMAQIEESVARYLEQLDTADRQERSEALTTKTNRLKEKIETLKEQIRRLELLKVTVITGNLKFGSVFPANRENAANPRTFMPSEKMPRTFERDGGCRNNSQENFIRSVNRHNTWPR